MKRTVRWRMVSDEGSWSCWELDGGRIIIKHPKKLRKGKVPELLDDRVLRILSMRK